MSENTAAAACTDAEWQAAKAAGLLWAELGTTAQEQAIHAFASSIRRIVQLSAIDAVHAARYRYLAEHAQREQGSGGKFDLPKYGVLEFSWEKFAWSDGRPYVAQELGAAIDEAIAKAAA